MLSQIHLKPQDRKGNHPMTSDGANGIQAVNISKVKVKKLSTGNELQSLLSGDPRNPSSVTSLENDGYENAVYDVGTTKQAIHLQGGGVSSSQTSGKDPSMSSKNASPKHDSTPAPKLYFYEPTKSQDKADALGKPFAADSFEDLQNERCWESSKRGSWLSNPKCLAMLLIPMVSILMLMVVFLTVSHVALLTRVESLERRIYEKTLPPGARPKPEYIDPHQQTYEVGLPQRKLEDMGKHRLMSAELRNQNENEFISREESDEEDRQLGDDLLYASPNVKGHPDDGSSRIAESSEFGDRAWTQMVSRQKRSAKKEDKALTKKIKGFIKRELKRSLQPPVQIFMANFTADFPYGRFKNTTVQELSAHHMHCKPKVLSMRMVNYSKADCRISFYESIEGPNLLEFNTESGHFTTRRAGLYMIDSNITVIDTTKEHQIGIYVNDQVIFACKKGGFRCPHYNKGSLSSQYRICHMNGAVWLKKHDLVSVRTMNDNMSIRLQEKRNAFFTAILLKPEGVDKKGNKKKKDKSRRKRRHHRAR